VLKGEFVMENVRNNKGVTLVALAITVILMSIITLVVIRFISDDDGILIKAKDITEDYKDEQVIEESMEDRVKEEAKDMIR